MLPNLPFPNLLFRTIVCDPAWQPTLGSTWNSSHKDKARPQRFYPTLSLDEICAIKPPMDEQSHLYIWCVAQHVDWAYKLAEAWKADPVILWTWKKPGLGVGRFRCNTEHVLVARLGTRMGNPFGSGGRHAQATGGTCFEWPRGRHSEKPAEFYELVERLSPSPKLDMYARAGRSGWYCWGDEIGVIGPDGNQLAGDRSWGRGEKSIESDADA